MKYILTLVLALCGPMLWAQTDACEQYNEQGDSLLQAGQYERALGSYRRAQRLAHSRADRVRGHSSRATSQNSRTCCAA